MSTIFEALDSLKNIQSEGTRDAFMTSTNVLDTLPPGYTIVPASGNIPAYAKFTKPIEKSPNDTRSYNLILLQNGMEVLLITDPKCDKAAAALDVGVGHLADPEDLPGLAHFCEHLMFMGTEKFPKENDYNEYLTQNGGSGNAFTGMENTCYFFDVLPDALPGALDRFAQFFISPLFLESTAEREASAVDSENSKNLQDDTWRGMQLDKSTSNRDHWYWRFGTGNKNTLWNDPLQKGENVRARLLEWWEKKYSANLMKLAVISKDNMEQLVVSTFTPAVNRNHQREDYTGSPYGPEQLQTVIFRKTVKNMRVIDLTFPLPDLEALWDTKPGEFLSHFLGHEGPGSVLAVLKEHGWANALSAGAGSGAKGFSFFRVQMDLTEEGMKNWEAVCALVFEYCNMLNHNKLEEWTFNEVKQLSEIGFKFQEPLKPMSAVMYNAIGLSRPVPRERLLTSLQLFTDWNPIVIDSIVKLLNPLNCRITVSTQDTLPGIEHNKKEEWYGTEYTIKPFTESMFKPSAYPDLVAALKSPRPNSFIPQNLEILDKVEVTTPATRPVCLKDSSNIRVWYKKDDRWWIPKASAIIMFRSPIIQKSAVNQVHTRMLYELVQDALADYSYDAEVAGLSYRLESQSNFLMLTLDGYNDKLHVLAGVVLEKLRNLEINPKRFEIIKDQLSRHYLNFKMEAPYVQCNVQALDFTIETWFNVNQKYDAMKDVTTHTLEQFTKELFSRLHIEVFALGNLSKNNVLDLAKLLETTFQSEALTKEEIRGNRSLIISQGKHWYRVEGTNDQETNSCVEQITYISDVQDDVKRAQLDILITMLQDPIFEQLRTQEQLGYIVMAGLRVSIGFQALRVMVQSERDPVYLEERINAFWAMYANQLQNMSDTEFEQYKKSVIEKKKEEYKTMAQEFTDMAMQIQAGYYDFEVKARSIQTLEAITKQNIIDFFQQYIVGPNIRQISIHVVSRRLSVDRLTKLEPLFAQFPTTSEEKAQLALARPTLAMIQQATGAKMLGNGMSQEQVDAFLSKIEEANKQFDVPGDVKVVDLKGYRESAEVGPYATPVPAALNLFPRL